MSDHAGATTARVSGAAPSHLHDDSASDVALWRELATAKDSGVFFHAWLSIVAASFPGVTRAEILLKPASGAALTPIGRWPRNADRAAADAFAAGAKPVMDAVVRSRQPAIESADEKTPTIFAGYPLIIDDELHGVALVEASIQQGASARRLIRHLQWASAWVEARLRRHAGAASAAFGKQATGLIDIVNAIASAARFHDACHAFATTLARVVGCEQAAIGWRRGLSTHIVALLQTASFERKYDAARAIEMAMDEAIDQNTVLTAPAADAPFVALAQEELIRSGETAAVVTCPMFHGESAIGAVTLGRLSGAPFGADEIALCDALCAVAGPILADKRNNDLSLPVLAFKRLRAFSAKLIGPQHYTLKVVAAAALAVALFLAFATGTYRIGARAQMEGEVRRALSAPFDGYIRAQYFRAGQIVAQDAVLAELQDNDLTLERLRHVAERRQLQLELNRALSKRDLAQANITRAQIDQKDAEIELANQMLARTQIRAPFDGVIVSGDLSQSVGRPVARGDTLFELASLNRYRVTLVVPELEMQYLQTKQRGQVLLAALPEHPFDFEITNITPVAHAQNGVNGFEVHAILTKSDPRIRPGMEGVAKVDVGQRNLAWIWTHGAFHWLRIKLWAWIP
jgi:hypothetical protein